MINLRTSRKNSTTTVGSSLISSKHTLNLSIYSSNYPYRYATQKRSHSTYRNVAVGASASIATSSFVYVMSPAINRRSACCPWSIMMIISGGGS